MTAPADVAARPLWFGPAERPLFGWLHVHATGAARGAVVLCPPLGLEGVCAHRSYRHLAEKLGAAGMGVLRFDYEGTGDSAGVDSEPGRVEAWLGSVRAAVELVRCAGAHRVAVVGMRMGATLAACEVARGAAVDALVLWDPCASGGSYLREQKALGLFSLGGPSRDDGAVEVPGIVYPADTVAGLSRLAIVDTDGELAERVLVLVRRDRSPSRAMVQRLRMSHVEWGDADGQAALLDVEPFAAREPVAVVDAVTTWVSGVMGSDVTAFVVPDRTTAVMASGAGGRAVAERIVAIGPVGLFGVVSEPAELTTHPAQTHPAQTHPAQTHPAQTHPAQTHPAQTHPAQTHPAQTGPTTPTSTSDPSVSSSPTVVLLNAGVIDHVGPSRLWVDFARRWAAAGARVLRFDLSGLGDSPTRPGQHEDVMYPPEAFDDLSEALRAVAPEDPRDVVLTGLCSGGYHAVEGGIALGVRRVCLVNPVLTAHPAEIHPPDGSERAPEVDPRRQATTARRRWVRSLPAHDLLGGIVDRLPDAAWWIINRVAVATPPARVLERLVESGVDTYIVCGENEARVLRRGQGSALRRLSQSGAFHMDVVAGIDHELFARRSRDLVAPMVTDRVLSPSPSAWSR